LAALWFLQCLVWVVLGLLFGPPTVVLSVAAGQLILAGALTRASRSRSLCANLSPVWPSLTLALLLLGSGGLALACLHRNLVLFLGQLVVVAFGYPYWCHFREKRPASATWR